MKDLIWRYRKHLARLGKPFRVPEDDVDNMKIAKLDDALWKALRK